jgi:hypothetical protein
MLPYPIPNANAITSASGNIEQIDVRTQNRVGNFPNGNALPTANAKTACEKTVGIELRELRLGVFALHSGQIRALEFLCGKICHPQLCRSEDPTASVDLADTNKIRDVATVS